MTTDVYKSESKFVDYTLPFLEDWLQPRSRTWKVARELGVGRTIADLVVLFQETESISTPADTLTIAESVILSSLRRYGPTRIDILEKRCGLQRTALRNGALERLVHWGLLERQRGGRIFLHTDWHCTAKIIAIEAKLTKWRDALIQARRHRRYADRAYVLIPKINAGPAIKSAASFRTAGVGLLLGLEDSIETAIQAEPSREHDWRREFVFSRLVTEDWMDAR